MHSWPGHIIMRKIATHSGSHNAVATGLARAARPSPKDRRKVFDAWALYPNLAEIFHRPWDRHTFVHDVRLMTSREITSGFAFWSHNGCGAYSHQSWWRYKLIHLNRWHSLNLIWRPLPCEFGMTVLCRPSGNGRSLSSDFRPFSGFENWSFFASGCLARGNFDFYRASAYWRTILI